MDLRQLEAFAAVMTTGSITGAGQMLGRSQPAVTRSIQDLEQELGLRLFERNGPKVTPTGEAFALRSEVEFALTSVHRLRHRAENICRDNASQVRIGATAALAAGLLPAALARLPTDHAGLHIDLRSLLAEQVLQAALAGTLDLGVVSLPLEHRGLDLHWIGASVCMAVVAAGSALAGHETIDLAALAREPGAALVTLSNPYRLRGSIDRVLTASKARFARVHETNSSINAVMLARAGLGLAIVDPATALGIRVEGVVARPLVQRIPFFFGVVSPSARPLSPPARLVLDTLEEIASEILPGFVRHPPSQHDALMQQVYGRRR